MIDEMVFDVNTSYFEENGGYNFAKQFYEETYKLAVREAGGEQYILSAVMHADEVNVGASAALGKDVYHYHLHVVYIPVVEKEVKWSKRCKDKALVGTVKEVINQVSHSKKWPRKVQLDENGEMIRNDKGKAILVNSYSLLQDRFYEHMKEAGFQDFERGERGSTAEHQADLAFKIQKDMERLDRLTQALETKEGKYMDLDDKIAGKKKQIDALDQRLAIRKNGEADLKLLDNIGKKNMLGQIVLTPKELKTVKSLTEEGAESRGKIYDLESMVMRANREADIARSQRDTWKQRYEELLEKTKPYLEAIRIFPQKVMEFLEKTMQEYKLAQQTRRTQRRERSRDYER